MSQIADVKTNIKANLDALKAAGTLGSVIMDDFKEDILSRDIPKFPCAILTTPAVGSDYETNRDNIRTFTFEIVVIQKGENITATSAIEDLIEAILNQFDNDPTLKGGGASGVADGGVEPSTSQPDSIAAGDKTYVVFTVAIRARAIKSLTFTP